MVGIAGSGGGGGSQPIAQKDAAETFAEPDVTVTHSSETETVGESISLFDGTETASRDADDSSESTVSQKRGLRFKPTVEANELTLTRSANQSGATDIRIIERSTDTTVATATKPSSNAQKTITGLSLSAGTEYYVELWNSSGGYSSGYDSAPAFPYTSPGGRVEILGGSAGGADATDAYAIVDLQLNIQAPSGSAIVEWADPTDIFRWDAATFTRTADGETVEVFIEDQNGNELAGPIERGDEIPATPDENPRFRIDISRADVANNPKLDSIHRRWVV